MPNYNQISLNMTKQLFLQLTNLWLWISAFGIGIGVVYGLDIPNRKCENISALGDAIYGGFYKLAWALSVGWVIFACCRGYGGKLWDLFSLFCE